MRGWQLAVVVSVVVGCGGDDLERTDVSSTVVATTEASVGDLAEFDLAGAEAYCTEQGGMLVPRTATWNTNADPAQRLELATRMTFCEFESTQPGDDAPSRISIDLVTLYSHEPTIAAIAYLSPVAPTMPETPSANPAEYNCRAGLFGSSSFGNTPTVGAWVNADEPVFDLMSMCVFADMSAIDEFGLLYHSDGTVRGADLTPILRYQPNGKLPAMFGDSTG